MKPLDFLNNISNSRSEKDGKQKFNIDLNKFLEEKSLNSDKSSLNKNVYDVKFKLSMDGSNNTLLNSIKYQNSSVVSNGSFNYFIENKFIQDQSVENNEDIKITEDVNEISNRSNIKLLENNNSIRLEENQREINKRSSILKKLNSESIKPTSQFISKSENHIIHLVSKTPEQSKKLLRNKTITKFFNNPSSKKNLKLELFEKQKETLIKSNSILSNIFKKDICSPPETIKNSIAFQSEDKDRELYEELDDATKIELSEKKFKNILLTKSKFKKLDRNSFEKLYKKKKNKKKNSCRKIIVLDNVYDSYSDDENDMSIVPNWYNIHPESLIRVLWNYIYELTMFFSICYFPYLLLDVNNLVEYKSLLIEVITDIILCGEIFMNCITGVQGKEKINYNQSFIISEYLLGDFFINLFTSFPHSGIIIIMQLLNYDENELVSYREATIIIKCFRFFHLLSWLKVPPQRIESNEDDKYLSILERLTKSRISSGKKNITTKNGQQNEIQNLIVKRILTLFLLFYLITHIFSCAWIFVGNSEFLTQGTSWLIKFGLGEENLFRIYISSFYYTLVTIFSIGYGDIIPVTLNERLYVNFFLFTSVFVYTFFISFVSILFQQLDEKEDNSQKIALIDDISDEFNINFKLKCRLKEFVESNENNKKKSKQNFFEMLPKHTLQLLNINMYKKKIYCIVYFKNVSEDFLRFTVPLLEFDNLIKDDIILRYGELIENFIMITDGEVDIELDYNYQFYPIAKVSKGFHYGDIQMFSDQSSNITLKVSSLKLEIFTISNANLKEIQSNFPLPSKKSLKVSMEIDKFITRRRNLAITYFDKHKKFDQEFKQILFQDSQKEVKKLIENHLNEEFRIPKRKEEIIHIKENKIEEEEKKVDTIRNFLF